MTRLAVLLLLMIVPAASAQVSRAPLVFVSTIKIEAGGSVVGHPRVVIRDGGVATIVADRPDGYYLRVNLSDAPNGNKLLRKLTFELYLPKNGRWELVGKPYVVTAFKNQSKLKLMRGDRGGVDLTVDLNDDFDGKISAGSIGSNRCSYSKLEAWKLKMSSPVSSQPRMIKAQFPTLGGGCCSAGCGITCCSDGPICCGDYTCQGSGCCN